jgi:hypothetical protein
MHLRVAPGILPAVPMGVLALGAAGEDARRTAAGDGGATLADPSLCLG